MLIWVFMSWSTTINRAFHPTNPSAFCARYAQESWWYMGHGPCAMHVHSLLCLLKIFVAHGRPMREGVFAALPHGQNHAAGAVAECFGLRGTTIYFAR